MLTPNIEKEIERQCEIRGLPYSDVSYIVHSVLNQELVKREEETNRNIGMLRQWLNEDRNTTPMVTNEDIKYWLTIKTK